MAIKRILKINNSWLELFNFQTSFTYLKYADEASNIASDEEIMENNYMFVVLWNSSVISHWVFPQCFFFFISGAKSKNNLRGYVAF